MQEAITEVSSESKQVVLASSSPRRQAYLRELGIAFRVLPADIDETPAPDEAPIDLARRLASSKARAVASRLPAGMAAVIIAADTVVAQGKLELGKPEDGADAARMLRILRASSHEVHSATSVHDTTSGETHTLINTTVVWMRDYSESEIASYVQSGDPLDKAGAYAIQHPVFRPAERIEGCLSGVVGLPLGDLSALLARVGIEMPRPVVPVCEAQTHFACCQRK